MSKISEDLLKQIQAEIDRRGEIPGSLDELNKIAGSVSDKYNHSANPDFEGLSPHQMHLILDKPFSPDCPVKYNTATEPGIVLSTPVFRVCALIIEAIRAENGLKLTPKGNLPRKIVAAIGSLNIYSRTNTKYPSIKALNEIDYLPAAIPNAILKLSGVAIKRKNKLQLSKTGAMLIESPVLLFQTFFITLVSKFNKGYLDGYESDNIGNLGMLYTVYLLKLHGQKQREASFYARLYFKAFPDLINEIQPRPYSKPEETAHTCFVYRTFDKGLFLFGLIDIEYTGKNYLDRKVYIKTNELFHHIFDKV